MKNAILFLISSLSLSMCKPMAITEKEFDCPEIEASEPFTETIYLNLDLSEESQSKWQLCHAELEDIVKPFVILANFKAEINGQNCKVGKMKFRSEPFLGNQNFYKILDVTKSENPRSHDGYAMYDVNIKVGLINEQSMNDKLIDFEVNKGTAFDYHITLSDSLQEFIACNIEFDFNDKFLFNGKTEKKELYSEKICCGAICASRFVY